jgi:hypothetical protein
VKCLCARTGLNSSTKLTEMEKANGSVQNIIGGGCLRCAAGLPKLSLKVLCRHSWPLRFLGQRIPGSVPNARRACRLAHSCICGPCQRSLLSTSSASFCLACAIAPRLMTKSLFLLRCAPPLTQGLPSLPHTIYKREDMWRYPSIWLGSISKYT